MKISLPRLVLIALCVQLLLVSQVLAGSDGKTGSTTVGCGGCHGGQSAQTSVVVEGPRTVLTGQTKDFAVVVSHANNQFAGFNAAIKNGNANAGTLQAVANCKVQGGEVTHANSTQFANGAARFEFSWTAPTVAGTYTLTAAGNAVNNDGRATDADDWKVAGAVQITVIGGAITAPATASTFCTGQPMNITWTQQGLGQIRLELSKDNFQSSTLVATVQANTLAFTYAIPPTFEQGTYALRMVDVTSGEVVSTIQSIVINAGPSINLQPEPTFVCSGKPLNLSVSATGTGLQYRWRRNGVDIAGGTKSILTINTVTTNEAGKYDCVVFGCNTSVTSNAVDVTVGVKPEITSQPKAATVCEGGGVTFTVAATGTDITYTWKKNNGIISGGTEPTLTIDAATLLDEGDYTCLIEGTCGPSATTVVAKLSVTEKPKVRTEPVDRSLKEGDTLSLAVVASGEFLTYQWFKDGTAIPNATSSIYRVVKVAKADSGLYSCEVRNSCDTITTRRSTVRITSVAGPGRFVLSTPTLDLGQVAACGTVDTLVSRLLVNDGGAPVTITSVSAEPIANIEVLGLTAPFVLDVNERRDVRIVVTPKKLGVIEASVTFFASSGNQTFRIGGDAVSGVSMMQDTLVFPEGSANVKKCNPTMPLPCAAAAITRIRIAGEGAATWKQSGDVALPIQLTSGQQTELCFESIAEAGADATVTVTTDVGDASFVLSRRTISNVDDVESNDGLQVFPNPMSDDLIIRGSTDEELTCQIMTVSGSVVSSTRGVGEVVWSRRDTRGDMVPSGLYLLVVERKAGRTVHKVIVR